MNLFQTLKKLFRRALFRLLDMPANVRLLRYRDYSLLIALQTNSLSTQVKMSPIRRLILRLPPSFLVELRIDVFRWRKGWPVRFFLTTARLWPYLFFRTFILPFKRLALYV